MRRSIIMSNEIIRAKEKIHALVSDYENLKEVIPLEGELTVKK